MNNLLMFACIASFVFAGNAMAQSGEAQTPKTAGKPFLVFDNMGYEGKPDLSKAGLIPSCVIGERADWKKAISAGQLPDEASFKEAVKSSAAGCPGPVVIDIEYVYLSNTHGTTDAAVSNHFKLFITLARWAHEAAPGHIVGYYGHGLFPEEPGIQYTAQASELLSAVDAFFPSMYVYGNETPAQWKTKLQSLVQKAREIAPSKPVYPYVWPQYHEGEPKALEFVDGDYMKFQLETARDYGADGVVFWSSHLSSHKIAWKNAPWNEAMLKFVAEKPVCNSDVKLNQP